MFLCVSRAKVMFVFEKMKKCKCFFEKTRKLFYLLMKRGCFSIILALSRDFCFNVLAYAFILFAGWGRRWLSLFLLIIISYFYHL